ncbi:hypothetical protein KM043_012041 [Ampulex compressa]|nr:hypothetical protein KM043_012041 [Ampulex compressa]
MTDNGAWSGLVNGGSHEKRLLNDLLDSYNVLERPVGNESDPLVLSFGLTLMQIIDVKGRWVAAANSKVDLCKGRPLCIQEGFNFRNPEAPRRIGPVSVYGGTSVSLRKSNIADFAAHACRGIQIPIHAYNLKQKSSFRC